MTTHALASDDYGRRSHEPPHDNTAQFIQALEDLVNEPFEILTDGQVQEMLHEHNTLIDTADDLRQAYQAYTAAHEKASNTPS